MTHVKTSESTIPDGLKAPPVKFPTHLPADEWLKTQPVDELRASFLSNGYVRVDGILDEACVAVYRELYERFVDGRINSASHRWDLGAHTPQKREQAENVLQIMWPSDFVRQLDEGPLHTRACLLSQVLLGRNDVAFDFDMLIAKAPHTDTAVPWHQDEGYWPDMPEKTALSCWTAIDESTVDNGCMWFVPSSPANTAIRKHEPASPGSHVLTTHDCSEAEGTPIPLPPGSCTFHHGRTLHYSRGNTTNTQRRAYITNFRPLAMIEWERAHNFDHGRAGGVSKLDA